MFMTTCVCAIWSVTVAAAVDSDIKINHVFYFNFWLFSVMQFSMLTFKSLYYVIHTWMISISTHIPAITNHPGCGGFGVLTSPQVNDIYMWCDTTYHVQDQLEVQDSDFGLQIEKILVWHWNRTASIMITT